MTNQVSIQDDAKKAEFSLIEQVVMQGDLSKLNAHQRVEYYNNVCKSVGLNPLTKPFDYIVLNGKLTLYATKNCSEQLRQIHGVSIIELQEKVIDDVYIIKAKARDRHGRIDESTGAVVLGALKGDPKANAMMKAETKAKRRVTLSICGLGWVDESETDSIPGAKLVDVDLETGEIKPEPPTYISNEQLNIVIDWLKKVPSMRDDIFKVFKIDNIAHIPSIRFDKLIARFKQLYQEKEIAVIAENLPPPDPIESLEF